MKPFDILPEEESNTISIWYSHHAGESKQNDIKFLTIFENSSYFVLPTFVIGENSLFCSYESKGQVITNYCSKMKEQG